MENAKRTYEILNSELHDELPALFDSRVLFMVTNMQTVFAAEEVFHSETAKVYSEMEAIIDKLAKDVQKGTLPKRAPLPKPQPQQINSASSLNSPPKATNGTSSPSRHFGSSFGSHRADYEPVGPGGGPTSAAVSNGNGNTRYNPNTTTGANQGGEMYDVPVGATTENLPPGVLYLVKASYKYQAEDVDELAFEVGEVINVVEYEDAEDQEEGWLMGYKDATGQKGMFPANFTRPI
jgi:amphiphysin